MSTEAPDIVVAVVPREKFSYATLTLDALLERTTLPFELIYVDGCSPAVTASTIERRLAGRAGTRILRFEQFLAPLESRSIVIDTVREDSRYLVILDNDVLVQPGWLEALVKCAEEERAGAVVPGVLIGGADASIVHHMGGETEVREVQGERQLFHRQHLEDSDIRELRQELARRPTLLLEDHCILARTELWKSLGPLDPATPLMTSVPDLSFRFQRSGEKLFIEPAASVIYLWGADAPITWSDVPQWFFAWSEVWNRVGMRRMAADLQLSGSLDEKRNVLWWMNNHRRVPLFPLFEANRRLFERVHLPFAGKVVQKLLERFEEQVALLIAEFVRLSKPGRTSGCPPLIPTYPRLLMRPFRRELRAAGGTTAPVEGGRTR